MRTALVIALALVAGPASAQQVSRQQLMDIRAACKTDLKTFCSGVQPGGGRLAQCLRTNAANLSRPCKDQLAALKPN